MLKSKPVVAFIPVRKGSKGVPGKNIYKLGGETLLERTIKYAKACEWIDSVYVSTDCSEMESIARSYSSDIGRLRPDHLSDSLARTVDVVIDEMGYLISSKREAKDCWILLLQVTTPLRDCSDLVAIKKLMNKKSQYSSLISLENISDTPPRKMKYIRDGEIVSYEQGFTDIPRQSLEDVYIPNGAFYLIEYSQLVKEKTFSPKGACPYVMPWERSVNIDSTKDIILLEALYGMREGK